MLEILSHQYLKNFLRDQSINWEHIYSFGRIVSKCIENDSTYLINSEIFSSYDWLPPILISLFLKEEDSTFILSKEKIQFISQFQIDSLKNLGFNFILKNDQFIFANHHVHLITIQNFLNDPNSLNLRNHRIVYSGIEDIKQDLKNHFRISLLKKDWTKNFKEFELINQKFIKVYDSFKKKFFMRKVLGNSYINLNEKEISFFSNFFHENSFFSDKFLSVNKALSKGWACWVKLNDTNLDWTLYLQPIDELSHIKEIFSNNKFVFLSGLRKDNFFQMYLKKHSLDIDLVINFKSNFEEKKISLYIPSKQLLPNNPLFTNSILDKCKKLILFRKGLTLVCLMISI